MAEHEQEVQGEETQSDAPYEAPEVEDLETVDGPAVTAAGVSGGPA